MLRSTGPRTRPCAPPTTVLCRRARLYIGLYVRGGMPEMPGKEDVYHWALLTESKSYVKANVRRVMYHVKEELVVVEGKPDIVGRRWEYTAERDRKSTLLVRIRLAKVTDVRRLENVLRTVPLRADTEKKWNAISWVRDALQLVTQETGVIGSSMQDWDAIRDTALWYVEKKKAEHRYDGFRQFDMSKTATWDMLRGKELTV